MSDSYVKALIHSDILGPVRIRLPSPIFLTDYRYIKGKMNEFLFRHEEFRRQHVNFFKFVRSSCMRI